MHRLLGSLLALAIMTPLLPACGANQSIEAWQLSDCTPDEPDETEDHTVARLWNEELLAAIRRDFPAPTVHSRNLFHVSAAMWDAWAAYDEIALGVFVDESHTAPSPALVEKGREIAMSFAAYRLLDHRYQNAFGADETRVAIGARIASLCLDADYRETTGDSAADFGNRIAETIIEATVDDGALEADNYVAIDYVAVNEPMIISQGGATLVDPNRWQPLAFEVAETQNRIPLAENVQSYVGPHWGRVTSFALDASPDGLPIDPGDPPYLGDDKTDAAFKDSVVEVIRYGATLDPGSGETIDISPLAQGDNPLGTHDGSGRASNPVTGEPYEPNVVALGDFGRVIAEFWADGPASETPPGHWNTLANTISDHPDLVRAIGGVGDQVSRLEWDVKLYFALNGAVHDAAIAAWGAKRYYDYVRPISMIRYMGGLGQSSDPQGASYHPDGLPLVEGLIEVVTEDSSAPGERHEFFDRRIGSVVVKAWLGNPGNRQTTLGRVGWLRAVRWMPYQRATFVTPAFAAYVSGHSAFSRAAAEVLTGITGSEYFPGGLGEWTVEAGHLEFEAGPSEDITLQWASYADAADQAGISRLYGGIHVRADDLAGRIIGAQAGQAAWSLAQTYFAGTLSS